MYQNIQSIPGIGKKTALMLIVISAGFKKFSNAKQLCSYIGLSPRIFESGTSVKGKARITKMGMSQIRSMLYVCAWSAKRYNETCKSMYERLVNAGKPKKVALIAVANKLLKQCFAIGTKNETFNNNYPMAPKLQTLKSRMCSVEHYGELGVLAKYFFRLAPKLQTLESL